MRTFESDCNHGKGNAVACHQVGEYLSVVKNDFEKAGKIFKLNCDSREHAPSCFNLGRYLREWRDGGAVALVGREGQSGRGNEQELGRKSEGVSTVL